jgi:MtrB/PioB family decaheme-associated outer membrane protein
MTIARSLKAGLAASVCLLPLQALAQSDDSFDVGDKPASAMANPPPTNWITVGGQYNSNRSYYLNRFTGAVDPGFYGIGDFHVGERDAWDSGGTHYWSVDGTDLGFHSRSVTAKIGQQGTWGLVLSYDGIPYYATNEFKSVWQSSGALVPGVPEASLPVNRFPATPQFPAIRAVNRPFVINGTLLPAIFFPTPSASLSGNLADYNLYLQRDIFTGVGTYKWNDWTITGAMRHEHKSGYQAASFEIGGTVGLTAAGTGATGNGAPTARITSGLGYFAQPIDYDTDRYDLTAAYGNERYQVQFGYMFSKFTDNILDFNAQNPFNLGALAANGNFSGNGTTPTGVTAPFSLPPSNSAHQAKVLLGYNLSPTTRINANFAYGVQLQNDNFVNNSGFPSLTLQQPKSSLDGLVQTIFGNIALVTRPTPKMDLRLSYTIDNRENQTSRNAYIDDPRSNRAVGEDCGFPGTRCINLPYSYEHQKITAELGYRILPQTKVTLNDTFDTVYRTFADASLTTSNTVTAKVRSQLSDDVFGSLSYAHQDRNGNDYINGNTWRLLTNGAVTPNTQGLIVFFEASRKHDEVKATLDFSPLQSLNTTFMAKVSHDTYPDSTYGLRNNVNFEIGPDVSWDLMPGVTTHSFYTFQQIRYEQASIYASAGTGTGPTGTGFSIPYTNKNTNIVHTLGFTTDWQAIPEVLKLSFNYNFSYGDTAYAVGDGLAAIGGGQTSQSQLANITNQPLPDITSMLNLISLRGEYTFRPNWTVIFGYAYERFSYKDFMNGISSTQFANAILPGTLNPNDSVHVVGAGLRVRF